MSKDTVVYTTGAYLVPVEFADGSWHWVVSQFEDDTFLNGETFNPPEIANSIALLVTDTHGE